MARGFMTTLGVGATDKITSALAEVSSVPPLQSWAIWTNRREAAPGTFRRIFDTLQTTGGADGAVRCYTATGASPLYQFEMNWSGALGTWTFAGPADNVWAHLLITYDCSSTANDPVAYLNGGSVAVTRVVAPVGNLTTNPGTYSPLIGNRPASDRAWDGMLADFVKYNRILSAAEALNMGGPLHYGPALISSTALAEYIFMPDSGAPSSFLGGPTVVGTAVQPSPPITYTLPPALVFHPLQA